MSKNMCATSKLLTLLIAILLYTQAANAGILRLFPTSTTPSTTKATTIRATATTTTTTTTTLKGITSDATILENTEATFLPKDIDEKLLTTTTMSSETIENAEEDEDTTENISTALSRDEKASVKLVAKKNLNPDAEVLKIETHKSDETESSKLLLSSLPKTSEKPIEENIEEPNETTDDQSETTTIETTTIMEKIEEQLNDAKSSSESQSQEEEDSKSVPEMEQKPHIDNAAHEVLEVEDSEDFVVVDEDENLEYEPYSETYVHSIQIVPSRLEAVLLEDFVHDW